MCLQLALYSLFGQLGFFYLKQKQRFSVSSFSENVSLISFNGRIWPRYSETHKFKICKTYFSKNNKNTLTKCRFWKYSWYEETVSVTGYSLQVTSIQPSIHYKYKIIFTSSQFTEYAQHQVLHWSCHRLRIMAADRVIGEKFEVMGVLQFQKGFYCFMWLHFPFENFSIYIQKDRFFV